MFLKSVLLARQLSFIVWMKTELMTKVISLTQGRGV